MLSDALQLHINGQNVASQSTKTFTVHNPMTGQPIFDCAAASIPDYETAIQHAHTAFQSWSQETTPSQRRLILLRAAGILTTYLDDETINAPAILSSEVSAVPSYVKLNILAAAAILRDTAGLATVIKGEMIPADRPQTTILVKREPMGVIFAISPWNAPVNLTARAIASPLICGNTVILKPSENSPKSQHLVVRALVEAGLPAGCLNFLPTSPADAPGVTEYAIKHKLVRKVNFTGSDRVGKIIAEWATSCMKTTLLELGGKAPAIVLRDADLENAAHAIVFGGLMNSGQICMSTERIIVHKDIADEFIAKLLTQLQKIKVGNHLEDPTVTLSGLFSPAAPKRILAQIDDAISQGAELLYGDRNISGPNKTIMQPHVLDKVKPSMPIFRDESFGPVMCLARAESEEEAIDLANDSEYTLCASIFTKDVLRGMELASQIRAGSCHINGPTVYIEPPLPNGGVGGRSGNGRFGGMAGIEEFTNKKMITLVKPGMKYSF